jgi:hypothetical protein
VRRHRDSLVGDFQPDRWQAVSLAAEHDGSGAGVGRSPVRRPSRRRRGDDPDFAGTQPVERPPGAGGRARQAEDRADRPADRVPVEDIGARIADEERVDAGGTRRPGDRAEIPRPLDGDGDRDERLAREGERLERGRRPADDGEEPVRPPLGQARERGRAELDDVDSGSLGSSEEIGVAPACEQVRRDVELLDDRSCGECGSHRARSLGEAELA